MNAFSVGKCYNFGKMIPEEYDGSWDDLMISDHWTDFNEKHQMTDAQINYIKRGFMHLPMHPEQSEGNLFPFGNHKGKPFEQVPDKYWDWVEKQEWLHKWPSVKLHALKRIESKKDSVLSKEDVASILQKID